MPVSLANPLADPLFGPAAAALGSVLASCLALLSLAARGRVRWLLGSVLFRRWLSWAVIGPVYLVLLTAGEAAVLLLVSALAVQGLREYARFVELPAPYGRALLLMGAAAGPVALWSREAFLVLPAAVVVAGSALPLLTADARAGTRRLGAASLGFLFFAWLPALLLLVYVDFEAGPAVLLALGMAVALSDVGAFTIGSTLGRRPLAPALSPNKTWEGVAGNLLGAYVGFGIVALALPIELDWIVLAALPLLIAAGAVWGDLLVSLMKREFGVKDSGAWLPGMGGLLDRVDSLVIALPLAYLTLRISGAA